MRRVYAFLALIWGLLVACGGIMVVVLGPISVDGFGSWDPVLTSVTKAVLALLLVAALVLAMVAARRLVFDRLVRG